MFHIWQYLPLGMSNDYLNFDGSDIKFNLHQRNEKVTHTLFCLRDIQVDEEIRYDYGVKNLPWTKPSYYSKPEVPLTTPLRDTQSTEKAV